MIDETENTWIEKTNKQQSEDFFHHRGSVLYAACSKTQRSETTMTKKLTRDRPPKSIIQIQTKKEQKKKGKKSQ
jgi:hypothetical protein